ncbi:MAG: LysR family transcriptional regulator [Proteobacteria bacterium]|nr:LysR family transcriptional regulator [Pseudomonadota bacterium]
MRSLNPDQLRTLAEVVALGNFSAAARRLNLTQPAVSLQIRELESRFGVQLIERRGRQAYATVPGQELVEHAARILSACETAEAGMRRFREGWIGRVSVATTLTALTYELPPILRKLRREHPKIELLVTNMPTRDSVDAVLQNTIDLALVTLPIKGTSLRVTPLRPEMLVAILPPDAKEVPDVVTPEFAATHPLILEHARGAVHALVTDWLGGRTLSQGAPMRIGTIEAVKQCVAAGLGLSIVPDIAVSSPSSDYVVRPLRPAVPCTLALIEQQGKPDNPALRIVRDALLELRAPFEAEKAAPRRPFSTGRRRARIAG